MGGQPSLLRTINLRATFDFISSAGPVSAPRVAQATGLSRPTVSEVLQQLLGFGLIRKLGRTSGQAGPTAQLYDVNPHCGWVLSVDVGRQWMRIAAVDLTGKEIVREDERLRGRDARRAIDQLAGLVERVSAKVGDSKRYVAVIGAPGSLAVDSSHITLAPGLPGWESPDVINELREMLSGPVLVENDVNLAAIGEFSRAAASDARVSVLLWIGTAVGMAVVLDGVLYRGASGLAGEIGYLPIGADPAVSRRSPQNRYEPFFDRLVNGEAIMELARAAGLNDLTTAVTVVNAAREGDPAASKVISTIAQRLAYGLAAVAAVLDPDVVMLGGGIGSGAGNLLVGPIRDTLYAISPLRPHLTVSELGPDAVLAGAKVEGLRLAREQIFGKDNTAAIAGNAGSLRPLT
jgi:predicted NBD/HSP70 family sugar kinase